MPRKLPTPAMWELAKLVAAGKLVDYGTSGNATGSVTLVADDGKTGGIGRARGGCTGVVPTEGKLTNRPFEVTDWVRAADSAGVSETERLGGRG